MLAIVITMFGWQRGQRQDGEGDESEEDGRVPIKSSCNLGVRPLEQDRKGKRRRQVYRHLGPTLSIERRTTMIAPPSLTHPLPHYPQHHSTPATPSSLCRWSDFCMPPLPPPRLISCCVAQSTESNIPLRSETPSSSQFGPSPPPMGPTSSSTSPVWAIPSQRAPSSIGRNEKGTG